MSWRPELQPDALPFWQAWTQLSGSRNYSGMGSPLGIPISEVYAWLMLKRIHDPEDRDDYTRMIAVIDAVYLQEAEKQRQKERDKPKGRRQ